MTVNAMTLSGVPVARFRKPSFIDSHQAGVTASAAAVFPSRRILRQPRAGGGTPGSPMPSGGRSLGTRCTSMSGDWHPHTISLFSSRVSIGIGTL